jgi:hypothetical protein
MSRYPLPWFSFPVGSVVWTMYVTNERATPKIKGCEGLTLHDQYACFVHHKHARNERAAQAIALHEIDHAVAWGSGASLTLYKGSEDAEETAIQTLTPPRFDTLVRAGLLTFPALPTVRGKR